MNDSGLIPRPRHGHRAVAVRELMIIFGGGNEGIVDELHAYNTVSNQWFCPVVKGDVPPGCAAFGLAADNTRLVFYGGMIEYGHYSDTLYELQVGPYFATGNISSKWEWKKLKPKLPRFAQPPSPRLGHSFTFMNDKFYMFGGLCQETDPDDKLGLNIKYSNDLYVLEFRGNGCFWELPQVYGAPPDPRESHTAVGHTDSLGNPKLIIYGGMAGVRLGDISVLDLSSMTWSQIDVDGPKPLPRSLHSSSVVGDKMYVFGGWVPTEDNPGMFEQKWVCSNSLARLNLNTYKWEEVELDCLDGYPQPRAGHCAVVVGSRIYVWSGRDGYTRAWDVQVCCKDLWFLEVGKPGPAGKVHLVKAGTRMLELSLPEVPFCDSYLLQIMPYSVPGKPKAASPVPVKRKRKLPLPQTDWADDDVGPMLAPISPLPTVPLPLPSLEEPLPPISICDEPLQPFMLTPPKPPPIYTAPPKPLPRLPHNMFPPQPFVNQARPVIHHPASQHQPTFIQHHNIVRSTAPSNTVQYVPLQEFSHHFPKPDPNQVKHPSMVISKPFNNPMSSQSLYPTTMDLIPMTPVPAKAIPQRGTVVKMMNPSLGSFSQMKVQPPAQAPPPKHTIIINKPANKQQIVVVSSAPTHHQPFHAIQTIARPANFFPPPKKLKVALANGINTFPVHARLPPQVPTRVQVQNPAPMYKNVKLQVNGKTLTVMMPCTTASVTPVTAVPSKFVGFHPQVTVSTSSCQPKFSVRQETSPQVPTKQAMLVQPEVKLHRNDPSSHSNELKDCAKEVGAGNADNNPQTVIITGKQSVIDVPTKVIGQPIVFSEVNAACSKPDETPSCSMSCKATTLSNPYENISYSKSGNAAAGSKSGETTSCSKPVDATESLSISGTSSESKPESVLELPELLPEPPSNIKISKTSDGAVISWSPPSKGPKATGYCISLGIKADENYPNRISFRNVYTGVNLKTEIPQASLDRATLHFPKPTIIFRVSARNELGLGPATQVRWLQDAK